jgi:hypothetical protein
MVRINGVGDLISCSLCFYGDGELDGDMKKGMGWRWVGGENREREGRKFEVIWRLMMVHSVA